jgi:uncharacterized protein (TIGR02118 family)
MIKTVAFIARRSDVDRAAFRDHYERVHAPLALPHLAGIVRYARNHVVATLAGDPPDFDCASEFWWRDGRAIAALLAHLETQAGAEIRRDEETFMDRARNTFFAARDAEASFAPQVGTGAKVLALGRRDEEEAPDAFLARWTGDAIPALLDRLGAPRAVIHDVALAGAPAPWDCATWIWLGDAPERVAGWRPAAARACAVRLEACETPIPVRRGDAEAGRPTRSEP